MASIEAYDIKSGRRYRVRYLKPDGRPTDRKGFKTKREAELFKASVAVSKSRGEFIEASAARVTVGELGALHLANQTHLKPSSLRVIQLAWSTHVAPRWSGVPVGNVRHSDIQSWVTELTTRRGATTVIRAHGVLSKILETAVKDRRLASNPALGMNLPRKTTKAHTYLTHEQVHRVAELSGEHRTLVLLLAYSGLRWGEAAGLRVRDLELLRRRVNVNVNAVEVGGVIVEGTPKTHKRRSVPLVDFLLDPLSRMCIDKGPDDLVFSDKRGQHLRRPRVSTQSRSWFKNALAGAGVEGMTIHDLRHTSASLAISANGNVKVVQRMLGHAQASMTLDTYADLFDSDLEAVADGLSAAARAATMGDKWATG